MTRSLILTATLALVGLSSPVNAQSDPSDRIVTGYYYQYLGRRPSPEEVYSWASQLRAGKALQEIQVGFLASEEYYNRNGRNPWDFIVALYRDVLSRYPSTQEVEIHLPGYRAVRGNRIAFARQFLQAAERELRDRSLSPAPPPLPPEEYEYQPRPGYSRYPRPRVIIPEYRR